MRTAASKVNANRPSKRSHALKELLEKQETNLLEIKARDGTILAFASQDLLELHDIADDILLLPETSDDFSCFLYSVASQLLAYFIALEKKAEIDQPRNLAKSVTVE